MVGLHRRTGKADKDPIPPEVKRRDPRLDVRADWVAVDVGAASTVVAVRGERGGAEFVRIGADGPVRVSADNENPSEVAFETLARTTKAWRDRVILPADALGRRARRARSARHARSGRAPTSTSAPRPPCRPSRSCASGPSAASRSASGAGATPTRRRR